MSRHTVCSSSVETVSCKKFCRRFAGHHISLEKQTNPVCILRHKFHIMRNHENRDTMLLKLLKDFSQFLFILCIQSFGWFIHQKNLRLYGKRSCDTDTLLLRCEHYARCVSLYGDGFEPLFDDNFFDLLPGETKCIRVLRSPSSGVIYAETAYDQTIVSCQWKKEKEK